MIVFSVTVVTRQRRTVPVLKSIFIISIIVCIKEQIDKPYGRYDW